MVLRVPRLGDGDVKRKKRRGRRQAQKISGCSFFFFFLSPSSHSKMSPLANLDQWDHAIRRLSLMDVAGSATDPAEAEPMMHEGGSHAIDRL